MGVGVDVWVCGCVVSVCAQVGGRRVVGLDLVVGLVGLGGRMG